MISSAHHRSMLAAVLALALLLAQTVSVRAQAPVDTRPSLCPVATVRGARNTVITQSVTLGVLGPLFTDGGSFSEHGVDEPCDADRQLGPFIVGRGGKLKAHIVGEPAVPNRWSLHNYNTVLNIYYRPRVGRSYGPQQLILELSGEGENSDLEGEASWPGPGLLMGYISGPWGSAPLSYSCYAQSYQASAEVVWLDPEAPAIPGMEALLGDTITTGPDGSATLTLDANAARVWLAPNTSVTMNSAQEAVPGTEQVALWFRPRGVGVQEPGTVEGASVDLGMPEWLLALKARVDELWEQGYTMPRGMVGDDLMYWFGFRESTLLEAYNRVIGLEDPAEAAVEFRLFMESRDGQWNLMNAGEKGVDLLSDLAMAWILPNEFNAVESLLEWLVRPVPLLGQLANLKNVKDSYERVMQEVVLSAANQRASRALATFENSRGWTAEQTQERIRLRRLEVEHRQDILRAAAAERDVTIGRLAQDLNALGCGAFDSMPEAQVVLCAEAERALHYGRARAEAEFSALLREQTALILEAQTEAGDLATYRLPVAQKQLDSLKGNQAPQAPMGLCLPKPAQMFLRTGAAQVISSKAWAPLLIYVVDSHIIPKGTSYTVEMVGEEQALVRVLDGEVEVLTGDGRRLAVLAGQQAILPEGAVAPLRGSTTFASGPNGPPPAELGMDVWASEPYGSVDARFHPPAGLLSERTRLAVRLLDAAAYGRPVVERYLDGRQALFADDIGPGMPSGWHWLDTQPYGAAPREGQAAGDASWEVPEHGVLRVTVPPENDLWGGRADAPRLLHKVTGDFDLEAEVLLECEGLHLAISEFVIFAPGSAAGFVAGQMELAGLQSEYLVAGGGWHRYQNLNRLTFVNRPYQDGVDPGTEPVRLRLSRRGEVLKTYWSLDDGASWTLSERHLAALPETVWAGFVFRRMAYDGLYDAEAVTTLRDVRLTTAPLGSLPDPGWDLVSGGGQVTAGDATVLMSQDGAALGYVQAYSPWTISGDFDLTVRFDASAVEVLPGQERVIQVAVSNSSEQRFAYIRHWLKPERGIFNVDVDLTIEGGGYRYVEAPALGPHSGRLRLVRQGGVFSAYYDSAGEWVRLDDWKGAFDDPVHLDLRYQWVSAEPTPTWVRFTIESLVTPEVTWFGPLEAE